MRILLLNWRDVSNPAAGGAESYTEEIGKRLVRYGNEVCIFTSRFEGCESETNRYGMRIKRRGGKLSVYSEARKYVRGHGSEYDIIVDEINTLPFRISKVAGQTPVVALIHQLAREIWFYETKFPISVIGYFALEPLLLRGYTDIPTITVSDSTRQDLLDRGFRLVRVIRNGISAPPLDKLQDKNSRPIMVFLGRLVKSKLPQHAIAAFRIVKSVIPQAELWIIGDGYLRNRLERDSPDGVKFLGRIDDKTKFEILRECHILLAPSVREGWGISIIEANAMGTPAVGYAVRGLRDSIKDNITGYLVEPGNYCALAKKAIEILSNSDMRLRLSNNALLWSKEFSWDNAAKDFLGFLQEFSRAERVSC